MFKLARTIGYLCAGAYSLETGFVTSLDLAVLDQAKDTYWDKIISVLNGLEIPDFYQDKHDYMRDNHFYISEDKEYVQFYPDTEKNALVLANKKVSASFKTKDFSVHIAPLTNASGHAEVEMHAVDIEVGIAFSVTTLADGRMLPYVTSVDVKCDIDRHDITIHMGGSLLTDIGSLFEIFFKGPVADAIEDTIRTTLTTVVPDVTNKFIEKTDGQMNLGVQNLAVDYQTQDPVKVTDTKLNASFRGLFFDTQIGEEIPVEALPAAPETSHPEQFQTLISAWSVNSFLNTLTEVSDPTAWIRGAYTCGELNTLLPGISQKYGADTLVDIKWNLREAGDFAVFQSNQEMQAVMTQDLQFWVHATDAELVNTASIELVRAKMGIEAITNEMTLTLKISTIHVDEVKVLVDEIGGLNGLAIKTEINNSFRVIQPRLNRWLAGHPFALPTQVLGVFELTAITLDYYDGWVYAGLTPVFIGQTFEHSQVQSSNEDAILFVECVSEQYFDISESGEEQLTIVSYDLIFEVEFKEVEVEPFDFGFDEFTFSFDFDPIFDDLFFEMDEINFNDFVEDETFFSLNGDLSAEYAPETYEAETTDPVKLGQ